MGIAVVVTLIACHHVTSTVTIDSKATDEEYKKEIDRIQDGMKESYARQLKNLDRTLDVRISRLAGVGGCCVLLYVWLCVVGLTNPIHP